MKKEEELVRLLYSIRSNFYSALLFALAIDSLLADLKLLVDSYVDSVTFFHGSFALQICPNIPIKSVDYA